MSRELMDLDIDKIKARVLELAKKNEGFMPPQKNWDRDRGPGMPSITTLRRRWGTWTQLAEDLDLATATDRLKVEIEEGVFDRIKDMSLNGHIVPAAKWDREKLDTDPSSTAIRHKLDISWGKLARRLGLDSKWKQVKVEEEEIEERWLKTMAVDVYEPEPLYRPCPGRALSKMANPSFCMQNDFAGYKVR